MMWSNRNACILLKVLSYWNLNNIEYDTVTSEQMGLKYYHIGI